MLAERLASQLTVQRYANMDPVMSIIAWVGGVMLAICALPQAWQCYKDRHADGLNHGFLFLWGGGEVLLAIYTFYLGEWALLFNYATNILLIAVMYRYKLWPKRS